MKINSTNALRSRSQRLSARAMQNLAKVGGAKRRICREKRELGVTDARLLEFWNVVSLLPKSGLDAKAVIASTWDMTPKPFGALPGAKVGPPRQTRGPSKLVSQSNSS